MDNAKVLKKILDEYEAYINDDPEIRRLYALLRKGKATQTIGLQFAADSGGALANTVVANVVPELAVGEAIVLEDALAIIPAALLANYDDVVAYLYDLQTELDKKAGIGLKPVTAKFDDERARGLVEEMTKGPLEDLADSFRSQVENFSMHSVDESMQLTAESRANAGLEVLVSRKYDDKGLSGGRECEWCLERECNEIPYQEAYDMGVFERHPGCGCLITYTNSKGESTYQAKKGEWYKSSEEALEKRKNYGL